jgi:hypothetical protein
MLKNIFNSFHKRKYIYEPHTGLWTFYASAKYIKSEVEKHGFELKEIIGNRPLKKLSKLIPAIKTRISLNGGYPQSMIYNSLYYKELLKMRH